MAFDRYCMLVVPPRHVTSAPQIEVVYCRLGATASHCTLDLLPGWLLAAGPVACD